MSLISVVSISMPLAEEQRLIEERLNPVQPGERRTRRLSAADEELMRRVQALSAEADPVLVKEQEPRMRG